MSDNPERLRTAILECAEVTVTMIASKQSVEEQHSAAAAQPDRFGLPQDCTMAAYICRRVAEPIPNEIVPTTSLVENWPN